MDKQCIVFDFDETLYNKDSLIQFHLFCVRQNPLLVCWFPLQLLGYVLHKLGIISTQQFKNCYIQFLSFYSEATIHQKAKVFWAKEFPAQFNQTLLPLMQQTTQKVVVITASPVVFIEPLFQQFPAITLLGTNLQQQGGLYCIKGKNCKGAEKVVRFNETFGPDWIITQSYSDSLSDAPILRLAQQAFMVKGTTITPFTD